MSGSPGNRIPAPADISSFLKAKRKILLSTLWLTLQTSLRIYLQFNCEHKITVACHLPLRLQKDGVSIPNITNGCELHFLSQNGIALLPVQLITTKLHMDPAR